MLANHLCFILSRWLLQLDDHRLLPLLGCALLPLAASAPGTVQLAGEVAVDVPNT